MDHPAQAQTFTIASGDCQDLELGVIRTGIASNGLHVTSKRQLQYST